MEQQTNKMPTACSGVPASLPSARIFSCGALPSLELRRTQHPSAWPDEQALKPFTRNPGGGAEPSLKLGSHFCCLEHLLVMKSKL